MTEKTLGVMLMAAPLLYWCWVLLRALIKGDRYIAIPIVPVVVSLLCWMAGRVVARESLFALAFGPFGLQ